MDATHSILQKAPPADLEKNKSAFIDMYNDDKKSTDVVDALNKRFPLPFAVMDLEEEGEKPFLLCHYNQVGSNKHRSPWTQLVRPGNDTASTNNNEKDDLKLLEEQMNQVWDAYKNLYYGHEAVGSVYLSAYDKGTFQGVFGIQKKCSSGSWDSLHHVQVEQVNAETKTCMYHVQSTVLNIVKPTLENGGECTVSATLSKDTNKSCKVLMYAQNTSHMENIGTLVEANEIDLRSNLERVNVPKTQEIIDNIQKKESRKSTQINPLMGLIMGSDLLKKRMSSNQS